MKKSRTSRVIPFKYRLLWDGCQRANYGRLYAKMAKKIPQNFVYVSLCNVTCCSSQLEIDFLFPNHDSGQACCWGSSKSKTSRDFCSFFSCPLGMLPWDCHEEAQYNQLEDKRPYGAERSRPLENQPEASTKCQICQWGHLILSSF